MQDFTYIIDKINRAVGGVVWGPPVLILILTVGLQFSVRLHWFQFTGFRFWMRCTLLKLFQKNEGQPGSSGKGISQFQALTTALAGSIGTGNIVGVATAITLGGPGAIFWMWVSALLGMMTIYSEIVLGMKYRVKDAHGHFCGGAMYYIERGIKSRPLALLFAGACVFASLGMGNMAQANSIAAALHESFSVPPPATGIVVALLIGGISLGGIRRIARVTEKVVPFMAVFYTLGGLVVIVVCAPQVPAAFAEIFTQAFSLKSAASGVGGTVIAGAMRYGVSRGIFTNEAGLGSSVMAHTASNCREPVEQGMWGIFQVFIDTIVICTITALCILCTGALGTGKDGAALSSAAFSSVFGKFGGVFVSLGIVLFAFATLLSWSYYGERGLSFLTGGRFTFAYKLVFAAAAVLGCTLNLRLVWDVSDTFNGFMAIPNLIALFLLSGEVVQETQKYLAKNAGGKKHVAIGARSQRVK